MANTYNEGGGSSATWDEDVSFVVGYMCTADGAYFLEEEYLQYGILSWMDVTFFL